MPCKIAVAGTGAIGAMMGGWLTRSGYDVTMLSLYRAEQARRLNRDGLTLEGYGPALWMPIRRIFERGSRWRSTSPTELSLTLVRAIMYLLPPIRRCSALSTPWSGERSRRGWTC